MSNKALAQAIVDALDQYAAEYNPAEDVPNQTIADLSAIVEATDAMAEKIMDKRDVSALVRATCIDIRGVAGRLYLDLERRLDGGLKRLFRTAP